VQRRGEKRKNKKRRENLQDKTMVGSIILTWLSGCGLRKQKQ
jgi:hypothetical protein